MISVSLAKTVAMSHMAISTSSGGAPPTICALCSRRVLLTLPIVVILSCVGVVLVSNGLTVGETAVGGSRPCCALPERGDDSASIDTGA